MTGHFVLKTQGESEDVIMYHRFRYYVMRSPIVDDAAYDEMERELCMRWKCNVTTVTVGSDEADDYPTYIRDRRRPGWFERFTRDTLIAQRWMAYLDNMA